MTREGGIPPAKASSSFPTKPTIPDERVQRIVRLIHSEASFDIGDPAIKFHIGPPTAPVQAADWRLHVRVISEQRLQRAAKFLKSSSMSVKEVAYTVGYEHVSSFI